MSQESLFFCDEKLVREWQLELYRRIDSALGITHFQGGQIHTCNFWSILGTKNQWNHLRALCCMLFFDFGLWGWKVGIVFHWSQPPGNNKNTPKVKLLVKISHLCLWCFGLSGVLQGVLKVLRFWGFRFWGLKELESWQVILTSEAKNMAPNFIATFFLASRIKYQDSMSLTAYIKHGGCIYQAHISGHLIVVCLWTWSRLPSTNIVLNRCTPSGSILRLFKLPIIIPEDILKRYDVFMHYPAISLEIRFPPHIARLSSLHLCFWIFEILEIFGHEAFPHLPRLNQRNSLQME